MKRLLILLFLILTLSGYSQITVDALEFQGKVTTIIRDAMVVPTGGSIFIWNLNTQRYEYAKDDQVWQPLEAVLDHGLLSGLADDDHPQYHNDARAQVWLNALYSNLDIDNTDDVLLSGTQTIGGTKTFSNSLNTDSGLFLDSDNNGSGLIFFPNNDLSYDNGNLRLRMFGHQDKLGIKNSTQNGSGGGLLIHQANTLLRTATFPDKDGTVAFLDDITSVSWSDPVNANIVPDGDGTRNLGSFTNQFFAIWAYNIDAASIESTGPLVGQSLGLLNLTADPAGSEGQIIWRNDLKKHRVFRNGAWEDLDGSGTLTAEQAERLTNKDLIHDKYLTGPLTLSNANIEPTFTPHRGKQVYNFVSTKAPLTLDNTITLEKPMLLFPNVRGDTLVVKPVAGMKFRGSDITDQAIDTTRVVDSLWTRNMNGLGITKIRDSTFVLTGAFSVALGSIGNPNPEIFIGTPASVGADEGTNVTSHIHATYGSTILQSTGADGTSLADTSGGSTYIFRIESTVSAGGDGSQDRIRINFANLPIGQALEISVDLRAAATNVGFSTFDDGTGFEPFDQITPPNDGQWYHYEFTMTTTASNPQIRVDAARGSGAVGDILDMDNLSIKFAP